MHDLVIRGGNVVDGSGAASRVADIAIDGDMLTHWTRDRTRGPKMLLEYVVHRQTRQTAELYGLHDRGLLAPGMRADVNVIDAERLTFGSPRMAWDLPGGAPRLVEKASGYRHTICAGVETVSDDEFTGALSGRLVRGPR